jgi:hypothetical protein
LNTPLIATSALLAVPSQTMRSMGWADSTGFLAAATLATRRTAAQSRQQGRGDGG